MIFQTIVIIFLNPGLYEYFQMLQFLGFLNKYLSKKQNDFFGNGIGSPLKVKYCKKL